MQWSRYNYLFTSHAHGHLLYNALSNAFAAVDEPTYRQLEHIRQAPDAYDFTQQPGLYVQLTQMKALVADGEEAQQLNLLKLKRWYAAYDTSALGLTIAPTLACNFACPYCYEGQHRPAAMTAEIAERIVVFIRRFGALKALYIFWLGGEPLLAFERMQRLTANIKTLGIPFEAALITNGYLLTSDVIQQFDDLNIKTIQITLDGPPAIHDRRRFLASGGPTYQRILANIDHLLRVWKGALVIRVNVDQTNAEAYHLLHAELRHVFKGAALTITPGIVTGAPGAHPDHSCLFSKADEVAFAIRQYRQYGITDLWYYPAHQPYNCTATTRNSFVIGPEGELYKCWEDIGNPAMVVGHVDNQTPWNVQLIANYMVGTSYFDDPVCQRCFYMPVCDGGCAHLRLQNQYASAQHDTCIKFTKGLPELLEIYYELKQQRAAAQKSAAPPPQAWSEG
jgi:uncharacterized protein